MMAMRFMPFNLVFGVFALGIGCSPCFAYDRLAMKVCLNSALSDEATPQALDACSKVIDDEGVPAASKTPALVSRSFLYLLQKDLNKAAADLTEFIRLEPANPFGYSHRAYIRLQLSDFLGAIEDSTAALQRKSGATNDNIWDEMESYHTRAQALEQLGQLDRAVEDYRSAGVRGRNDLERLESKP